MCAEYESIIKGEDRGKRDKQLRDERESNGKNVSKDNGIVD